MEKKEERELNIKITIASIIWISLFILTSYIEYNKHTELGNCYDRYGNEIQELRCNTKVYDNKVFEIISPVLQVVMVLIMFLTIVPLLFQKMGNYIKYLKEA